MTLTTRFRVLICAFAAIGLALPAAVSAQPETLALGIDGISTASSEDSPGILYILPWQPPTLPRRTRGALDTNAAELLTPMDPKAFEGHQKFQQSLDRSGHSDPDSKNILR